MKKRRFLSCLILGILILCVNVHADDVAPKVVVATDIELPEDWYDANGNTYWYLRGDEVSIAKSVPTKSENDVLIIPDTLVHDDKVYRVVQAGDGRYCEEETFDPISILGQGYTKIVYGRNIHKIEERCHTGMKALKEVEFLSDEVYVSSDAYRGCSNLSVIHGMESIVSISTGSFRETALTQVRLGNKCIRVGDWAFADNKKLNQIKITPSVQRIKAYAFYNCKSLKKVNIPNGVRSIGANAFDNCRALKYVSLPKSLQHIGSEAFLKCNKKMQIRISKKNKKYVVKGNKIRLAKKVAK